MQLVKSDFVSKTQVAFSSAARKASCSHGWLKLLVQCLFGAITVSSFILIVILSFTSTRKPKSVGQRCTVQGCRVVCYRTPYNGEYEEDIIFAVAEAETTCMRVLLTLNKPEFYNATLPPKWLSQMRTNIHELAIVGGNLRHISPQTFMTQFTGNIRCLVLEDITILNWRPDMLVGLSNLEDLCIRRCYIMRAHRNALEAVDDTLNNLMITSSGQWNPSNLTGSTQLEKLSTVVFSSNNFGNILDRNSFSGLNMCKVLYLNSCGITAIGAGAFNFLLNIEVIYLNNNFLVTVPSGLFDTIALKDPRPRINIQYNMWHCDCSSHDLRLLSSKGMLIVDPVCHYPINIRGQSFLEFEKKCSNITDSRVGVMPVEYDKDYVHMDGSCGKDNRPSDIINTKVVSPVELFKCSSIRLKTFFDISLAPTIKEGTSKNQGILKTTFAVKTKDFSMVEISARKSNGYGLIWFQSHCPHTVYCLNVLPDFLRVYNLDVDSFYIFCPVKLNSEVVDRDDCVTYSLSVDSDETRFFEEFTVYVFTALACLMLGAMCVYLVIRKFPTLLKGSSRILFVKHKNVEALILPPKIPLRKSLTNIDVPDYNDKNIFVVPDKGAEKCARRNSIGSYKSSAPSYISALQPTEDQLVEWRLRNLDNVSAITACSMDFGFPSYTLLSDDNSLYYAASSGSGRLYESLKQASETD